MQLRELVVVDEDARKVRVDAELITLKTGLASAGPRIVKNRKVLTKVVIYVKVGSHVAGRERISLSFFHVSGSLTATSSGISASSAWSSSSLAAWT